MCNDEEEKLSVFYDAISALGSSKNFECVLMFCLKVGNYINGDRKLKSQAFGFELKSLKKFNEFSKNGKNPTLLEYIYLKLRENNSSLLEWTNELECLKYCEKSNEILNSVTKNTKEMKQTFTELKERLNAYDNNNSENSKGANENEQMFYEKMNAFYQKSIEKFNQFETQQKKLITELKNLNEYFAMSNSNTNSEQKTKNESKKEKEKTTNESKKEEEKEKTIGIDCSYFSIINEFREEFIQVGIEIEKKEKARQKNQNPKQKQKEKEKRQNVPLVRQKSLRDRRQSVGREQETENLIFQG